MKVDRSAVPNMACAALIVAVVALFGFFLSAEPSREPDHRAADVVTVVTVRRPEAAAPRPPTSPVPPQPDFATAFAASDVARSSDAVAETVPVEPPDTPPDPGAVRGNEDRTGPPYGPNDGIGGIPDASVFGPGATTTNATVPSAAAASTTTTVCRPPVAGRPSAIVVPSCHKTVHG